MKNKITALTKDDLIQRLLNRLSTNRVSISHNVLVKRRSRAASGGGPQARNVLERFVMCFILCCHSRKQAYQDLNDISNYGR